MTTMQPPSFDEFERGSTGTSIAGALPYAIGLLLILAMAWFVYGQWTSVRGVAVEAPSPQIVSMLPLPPPPPPPPEPKEKPPEPTEQPQPAPAEAPKAAPQPQAAPVSINAPAQAGTDSFGLNAGSGSGIGSPSSTGTCLGTNCSPGAGGNGMSESFYRRYLSSTLQERVQDDERLSRLVFSADFTLTVTPDGRISGVQFVDARGRRDEDTIRKLGEILGAVRGLDPPPPSMRFPQKVTVRGRRAL